jgi:hypothetical protein
MRNLTRSLALAAALILSPPVASAWTPPSEPDPHAILNEARQDRIASRFDDALAKHVWIHNEALNVLASFRGVRRSFALADWAHLASKYEPAMIALQKARDAAESDVRETRGAREAFADFAAINWELGEERRTRELFAWIEGHDALLARSVYRNAESALVEAQDFAVCGKYVEPAGDLARIVEVHRYIDATMKHRVVSTTEKDAFDRNFIRQAATLTAILALNGRRIEAAQIADGARKVLDTPEMRTALEQALEGRVPPRFPSRAETKTWREAMP